MWQDDRITVHLDDTETTHSRANFGLSFDDSCS